MQATRVVDWSEIYILQESGWLDRNPNRYHDHNPNSKEGKKEKFQLEFVFELYFEVDDDIWRKRWCISVEYDSFVLDNIFMRRWQNGAKNVFVCRIIALCRSI